MISKTKVTRILAIIAFTAVIVFTMTAAACFDRSSSSGRKERLN